jgi:hypothetical protein
MSQAALDFGLVINVIHVLMFCTIGIPLFRHWDTTRMA